MTWAHNCRVTELFHACERSRPGDDPVKAWHHPATLALAKQRQACFCAQSECLAKDDALASVWCHPGCYSRQLCRQGRMQRQCVYVVPNVPRLSSCWVRHGLQFSACDPLIKAATVRSLMLEEFRASRSRREIVNDCRSSKCDEPGLSSCSRAGLPMSEYSTQVDAVLYNNQAPGGALH